MTAAAPNTPVSILCRGVTKSFGTGDAAVRALRGLDLEVHYGEMMALVGPSGCGKTTLLSILAGLLTRDSGECQVLGADPGALDNHRRTLWRGENVGFIFQQFNLIPQVTVLENVAVPLLLRGMRKAEAFERCAELLSKVGLGGRERTRPNKLTLLLVCDEPTSALDGATGQRIMQLIRDAARDPSRVVMLVTHDERIFHFADRIAHVDDGRVTHVSTPAEALRESAAKLGDINASAGAAGSSAEAARAGGH